MTKLMMNPETKPFLEQPDFLAILQQVAADPAKLTAHIGDPRFQKAMQVGLGISLGGAGMGGPNMPRGGMGDAPTAEPTRRAPPPPPPAPAPEPPRELTEEEKAKENAKAAAVQVRYSTATPLCCTVTSQRVPLYVVAYMYTCMW